MVIVTKVVWLLTKVKNIYFFHFICELTPSTYPKEPPSSNSMFKSISEKI